MKKLICLFVVAIASLTAVSAQQDYNWGVGIRFGGDLGGVTVKHKFNATDAFEAIVAMPWKDGVILTVLYQRHIPVIDHGFHLYYGAGGHVGALGKNFALGIDGIVGLEYKMPDLPLLFSIDYKPSFNIIRTSGFWMRDIALGIKVAF